MIDIQVFIYCIIYIMLFSEMCTILKVKNIEQKKWDDLMPKIIMEAKLEATASVHIHNSIKEISLNGKITILDISIISNFLIIDGKDSTLKVLFIFSILIPDARHKSAASLLMEFTKVSINNVIT